MSGLFEVKLPDIGDFSQVPVIEVLVGPGDPVVAEQSLITLESDKATMEVPSPVAGMVESVGVAVGDQVSEGRVIAVVRMSDSAAEGDEAPADDTDSPRTDRTAAPVSDTTDNGTTATTPPEGEPDPVASASASSSESAGARSTTGPKDHEFDFDLVVLGSGPGGYTAAFRAADLGLDVALIERFPDLGGVCLNVGCIPSKALLHTAEVIEETRAMGERGVTFSPPQIDLERLRAFKDGVVGRLTGGLAGLAKQRKVTVVQGAGRFDDAHHITVNGNSGERSVSFAQAIVAAGSEPLKLPGLPWGDPRLMDSTGALRLRDVPERLLVVGGGIIGLEMASVYHALGSAVTVVELTSQLMPGTDADLVRVLHKRLEKSYEAIWLDTRVAGVEVNDDALIARFEGDRAPRQASFDRVLVAVGRKANGNEIGAEEAGVRVDDHGVIAVDDQLRTNVPHIFAIGDITGGPMLAHRAAHQGKIAAEACAGRKSHFDARAIPSVAYTDPEVAWVGVTENEAREAGLDVGIGKFPWAASGRALGLGRSEGFTKLLFDTSTNRIVGAGIVGPHAGDLIAECTLAIEMGCEAQDLALTIHPHPTLSESIGMAAEAFEGTITDLYMPKKKTS